MNIVKIYTFERIEKVKDLYLITPFDSKLVSDKDVKDEIRYIGEELEFEYPTYLCDFQDACTQVEVNNCDFIEGRKCFIRVAEFESGYMKSYNPVKEKFYMLTGNGVIDIVIGN